MVSLPGDDDDPVRRTLPDRLRAPARPGPLPRGPTANLPEARIAAGVALHPATSLAQVVADLVGGVEPAAPEEREPRESAVQPALDLADVQVDQKARRAIEVAAASGHLLLVNPPGTPTTALIRRLPGVLPPLTPVEVMVSTAAHSVAGLLGPGAGLLRERPFRAPHFSVSVAAVIGGGRRDARPGEVSLAHNGVLLLDRISEFDRHTRSMRWARRSKKGSPESPGRGARSNCRRTSRWSGRCRRTRTERRTTATVAARASWSETHDRVPQPLRDRFDMTVRVERNPGSLPAGGVRAEDSRAVRARICRARDRQAERWDSGSGTTNTELEGAELRRQCRLDTASLTLVERVTQRLGLAEDGFDRIVRVARTIADLDEAADIRQVHVAEGCQYVGAAHRLPAGGDGRHAS